MKKVISEQNKTVEVSEVVDGKYYGVFYRGNKGFITYDMQRSHYVSSLDGVTCGGNLLHQVCKGDADNDFVEFVRELTAISEVYEFETSKELFKWLSE